jgi:hypothetical protein
MTNKSSTIVQRLWNYCNILRDERWLEAAIQAGRKRLARLRHLSSSEQAVLKAAFEGRLLSADFIADSWTGAD